MGLMLQAMRLAWPWVQGDKRLSVLIYHRVLPAPDPLIPDDPDVAAFDWQMRLLSEHTRVLPLPEAIQRLGDGTLPERAVSITFDDGYADNHVCALPILQKYELTATFFIATRFLNGGRMFNDTLIEALRRAPQGPLDLTQVGLGVHSISTPATRLQALRTIIKQIKWLPVAERDIAVTAVADRVGASLPDDLMMTDEQVLALRDAGMTIGAHTRSHPLLARLEAEQARAEIAGSRDDLRALTGEEVELFAYPNGRPDQDYTYRDARCVAEAGFRAAFSTSMGAGTSTDDCYQLPRFTPWARQPAKFFAQLVRNTRHPRAASTPEVAL